MDIKAGATLFRRRLPHWRVADHIDGTYWVTWRIRPERALLEPADRTVVMTCLRYFNGVRYRLWAAVVMDDHVHLIVTPSRGFTLSRILHTWKSFTSHEIQRRNARSGDYWQDESFDRIVRNEAELHEKLTYVVENPAKRWPDIVDYPWLYVWCDDA